jgi:type IV pilus assembly protein PilX
MLMATHPACAIRVTQNGAALITSLIMLLVMTLLATTTMNNATLEERMTSNAAFRERAFQAAESAAAEAFASSRAVYASSMKNSAGVAPTLGAMSTMSNLSGDATIRYRELEGSPPCGNSSIGAGSSGFALRYFEIGATGSLVDGNGDTVSDAAVTSGVTICGPS